MPGHSSLNDLLGRSGLRKHDRLARARVEDLRDPLMSSGSGEAGGHEIVKDSTTYPQEPILRIAGAGASVAAGTGETILTIPGGGSGFQPLGEYNPATAYVAEDVVYYSGGTWISLDANTGVTPVSGADWMPLAFDGADGVDGADGEDGEDGANGVDGKTWHTVSGAPGSGLGEDGDYAIDPATDTYYGPKASGAWPSGVLLRGADGEDGTDGVDGDDGTNGADGNTIHTVSGVPGGGLGVNGDYAIDPTADVVYGPKASGTWPSGTSMIGPQGDEGEEGPEGPEGPQGEVGGVRYATLVKYGV